MKRPTNKEYGELENSLFGIENEDVRNNDNEERIGLGEGTKFDDFTNTIQDIDFSELQGGFKKSFKKVKKKIATKKKKKRKPLSQHIGVKRRAGISGGKKKIQRVLIPDDRETIVQGVNKFILSEDPADDGLRNIHYYKGEKLEHITFTFDNTDSAIDFNFELFNPSMPLDYYEATSQNLNDKIIIAGGTYIQYTDVLFNLLANPAMMVNAKFVFDGSNIADQINQSLVVKNKNINGEQRIDPTNVNLQVDAYQFQNNIVTFNLAQQLNRPFIPDGMDVMGYTVLAGMNVTFAFFYKQHSLKKILFKEARENKILL